MDFDKLVQTITQLEDGFRLETGRAVNQYMTVRNWLMGFYIVEFEQNGADRAQYGAKVLETLAKSINRKGLSLRNLKLYRRFYQTYKQLALHAFEVVEHLSIGQTSAQFQTTNNQSLPIVQASAQSFTTAPELLLSRLSFSHLTLLMQSDDPLKRAFYEIESIRGGWAVRELKRQVDSCNGLSVDKAALLIA
jgi:predicted nuclease of restriction endonuclease-like (RecB) superfamily